MCGVYGIYGNDLDQQKTLKKMAATITHRGPDDIGNYSNGKVAFGNVRLSILDISEAANQPQYSESKQIALVQNGEIYNFVELRNALKKEGAQFKTKGDTEVLVRAFEYWGPRFVEKLNGMFAIAIHDARNGDLWLYRDRVGVKPLYIASDSNSRLIFASEIKAILAAGFKAKPNLDALAQFLALNYIPQPSTAFVGITHLPPGHMARINQSGLELTKYWDLASSNPDPTMTKADAKAEFLSLLDDATRIRMQSDAPFGALLSGGLDSSTIVGLMNLYQKDPIRTFSIGFDDPKYDETSYAKMASKRFGTVHETQVSDPDVVSSWPRFIWHADQPHGDVSFMPMDQISALASKDVKMVLTGDGGDELFGGYSKYLNQFSNGKYDQLAEDWEDSFVRQSGLLREGEAEKLLIGPLKALFHDTDPYRSLSGAMHNAENQDPINKVLFAETTTLLSGNNLVKSDRMPMANSLEVRAPFLDYRIAEFAFRMPGTYKLEAGVPKSIYKEAVRDLLGDTLTYRPKQMFTVPIGEWFKSDLEEFCRSVLLDGRFGSRGLVDTTFVRQLLNQHIAGAKDSTRVLRAMISLELWFRLFIDNNTETQEMANTPLVCRADAT